MISTYITDDEPHAVDLLKQYIAVTPGLQLLGSAQHAEQALAEISRLRPALVFLDIDLPGLSGIQLAGLLPAGTKIVFTTSYRQYGADAFEKNALDYLLKPFSLERFLESIRRFRDGITASQAVSPILFINPGTKGKLVKIDTRELLYAEAAQNYVFLHLRKQRIMVYLTLQELLLRLPGTFARIHKSFIVNLDQVQSIEFAEISLEDGRRLPLGRSYREQLQERLASSIMQNKR